MMEDKQDKVLSNQERDDAYRIYETSMARMDRQLKRLWIALIVAVIATVATNIAWLIYISQYDFESYEVAADNDGVANYIGNDGDIYNGSESFGAKEKVEEQSAS